jgi:hypothetical protein
MDHTPKKLLLEPLTYLTKRGSSFQVIKALFDVSHLIQVRDNMEGVFRIYLIAYTNLTVGNLSVPILPPF